MTQRVLESVFRRPLQFLLLLIVLPPIGVAVVYVIIPRTYPATASLWAFHRYEVIGLTGPETDQNSTPAVTQASALTELLQSHVFALSVANATDLPSTLSAMRGQIRNCKIMRWSLRYLNTSQLPLRAITCLLSRTPIRMRGLPGKWCSLRSIISPCKVKAFPLLRRNYCLKATRLS